MLAGKYESARTLLQRKIESTEDKKEATLSLMQRGSVFLHLRYYVYEIGYSGHLRCQFALASVQLGRKVRSWAGAMVLLECLDSL